MENVSLPILLSALLFGWLLTYTINCYVRHGFYILFLALVLAGAITLRIFGVLVLAKAALLVILPLLVGNLAIYMGVARLQACGSRDKAFRAVLPIRGGKLVLQNIRRGISVIAAAGGGKTESVIFGLLGHFKKHHFCGVIHDYKDFELTEMAYPLIRNGRNGFHIVSFGPIYARVNPIAPKYLPDEESVFEVTRVLLENLLEVGSSEDNGSSRFFKDAVEGLVAGLIWRLKTDYPDYCTLPHLIALYQQIGTQALVGFLRANMVSRAMADAFISGLGSERQTAGVKSTLANAFKKIGTKTIFMVLSADEIPLDINNPQNPAVVCVVNHPKKDASLSPVIATIIHTISKQMAERHRPPSFLLLEEGPTIRLPHVHRIPATLRSYQIVTVYVLQDKIQNEMQYGEKASKAMLANLSYQFFGKVNDPDTAKYYERFFEIVKDPTRSISKGTGLSWEARITQGEREVPKRRAEVFFRLRPGEFISFADGKDRKLRFPRKDIPKELPKAKGFGSLELDRNFRKIYHEAKTIALRYRNTKS